MAIDTGAEQGRTLTQQEAWEIFDRQARRRLNMSAEEFITTWDAGKFQDPDLPGVAWVASLLPLVR
ncbi:MAG: hypothetical protein ACR2PL_12670 [Dehalococcoidia bacterium]